MNIPSFDYSKILLKNLNPNIKQAHRGQVYIGFQCHQKCGFCYYKHRCNEKMFDVENVIEQIDNEYKYGIRDFEITGGEPSEYSNLRYVCQYIKNKYPTSKIAIITNGGLWNSNIWDLIDEVLISYHLGHKTTNYDKAIFPLGNTYSKVVKTVDMAKQNNILVRTNTVLGTFNLLFIHDIIEDLVQLKPSIINLLPVNVFDQATDMCQYIDYSLLRSQIKTEITYLKNKLPNSLVFVRYMPFCDMVGFEQHIISHLQHAYDWFDWNVELNGTNLLTLDFNTLGKYGSTTYNSILSTRKELYEKSPRCISCKYQLLCDGVEKTKNSELLKYIIPSNGKIVTDPMHYIGTTIQDFYKTVYH